MKTYKLINWTKKYKTCQRLISFLITLTGLEFPISNCSSICMCTFIFILYLVLIKFNIFFHQAFIQCMFATLNKNQHKKENRNYILNMTMTKRIELNEREPEIALKTLNESKLYFVFHQCHRKHQFAKLRNNRLLKAYSHTDTLFITKWRQICKPLNLKWPTGMSIKHFLAQLNYIIHES